MAPTVKGGIVTVAKVLPYVEIELDKPRRLMYDLNAMCAYEEKTGENMLNGLDLKRMNAQQVRVLLWAGLTHEDTKLTLQDVGKLITGKSILDLTKAVLSAWEKALPEPEGSAPLAGSAPR